LLVVFDLDGTLLISEDEPYNRRFILRKGVRSFFRRLSWLGIDTAIWTAATKDYADQAVSCIYTYSSPLFVMSRDHCLGVGTPYQEKPLAHVWALFPEYNETNTIIVDDCRDNFRSTPNNGIEVPEFNGDEDCYLEHLLLLLARLKGVKDVRRVLGRKA
jgi:phosphoglycolate phosphatase-like HAD superfamily hydrolase